MNRRNFFKSLLGLAVLPLAFFLPKREGDYVEVGRPFVPYIDSRGITSSGTGVTTIARIDLADDMARIITEESYR